MKIKKYKYLRERGLSARKFELAPLKRQ